MAPELMFYFWRSSYGLAVQEDGRFYSKDYYERVTQKRIDNIIKYLEQGAFDIILLQEVTNAIYPFMKGKQVNEMSIQDYIAKRLKMRVVSESFKSGTFKAGIPPFEQDKNKTIYSINSGVATLARSDLQIENVITAQDCTKKTQSPFTLDQIRLNNKNDLYLVNVHIKMNFPHILDSITDLFNCIVTTIGKKILDTIVMGDFNAHALEAAKELYKSDLSNKMFDIFASDLIDDHIFIGNSLNKYPNTAYLDKTLPILEMQINTPATDRKWILPDTKYKRSSKNQNLIDDKIATSDHSPIIAEIGTSMNGNRRRRQSMDLG